MNGVEAVFSTCALSIVAAVLTLTLSVRPAVGQPHAAGPSTQEAGSPNAHQNTTEYIARAFTTEDGLPQNVVRMVEQGLDGSLWVGTFDGLARYDGHSFERFNAAETDGLVSNRIRALHQAADSSLWIGTETGLSVMRGDTFRQIPDLNMVDHLEGGPGGTVWIAARGEQQKPQLYHSASDSVREVPLPDTLAGVHVADVAPAGRDSAWAVLDDDLFLWDGTHLTRPKRINDVAGTITKVVEPGPNGRLWIAVESGLVSVRGKTIRRRPVEVQAWTMEIGPSGTPWVTTLNDGLFRVLGDSLRRIEAEGALTAPLYGLTRDESGQWWVGTQGNGLVRLRPRLFSTVAADTSDLPPGRGVYADDDGTVWASLGQEGILEVSSDQRVLRTRTEGLPSKLTWAIGQGRTGTLAAGTGSGLAWLEDGQFEADTRLPDVPVTAIHRASTEALWIGTSVQNGGLYRFRSGKMTKVLPSRRIPARVNALHRDSRGAVWIGTRSKGLARLKSDSLTWYDTDDGLPYVSVRDVYETEGGTIWVGTYGGGMARFEGRSTNDPAFTPVTPEDGLPAGTINAIHEAPNGIFWMTSNEGVFRVPREQLAAVADGTKDRVYPRVFGTDDGMPDRECNGPFEPSIAEDTQGRLWIPTMKGPTVVDPNRDAFDVPASIPVRITGVRADGVPVPLDSLRLAPSTYRVSINFTGVSLRYGEDLSFRYRLDGGAWRPGRSRRTAEYTGLSPGTHQFEVQATVRGKTWHALDRPLAIIVRPHFYQTWWFRLLMGIVGLGLAVGAYRWRTYRLRRRQESLEATVQERTEELAEAKQKTEEQARRLKELDEAKSRFFANVSHEFRTPLTLIEGPVRAVRERLERGTVEPETDAERLSVVEQNTGRLLRLVDQLLGIARTEAGSYQLDARPTDVPAETKRIVRTFEPLAEREDLTLTVEAHPEPPGAERDRAPVYVDPDALEHVLSNLLSNAIKFTPEGGAVEVTATARDDRVDVRVSDTGPGIPAAKQDAIFDRFRQVDGSTTREQEGVGIGLAFARELVDLHGGTIEAQSVEGEGTTVTVALPRGREHLADDQIGDTDSPEPAIEEKGPPAARFAGTMSIDSGEAIPTNGHSDGEKAQSKLVLVVDDNAEIRRYVCSILEPDFAVIEAADGEQGLETAREALPDVILADVMMPNTDGHEMTRRLKENPETDAIPVIMLTARAGTGDEVEGLAVGANDYVTKPFDADVLRQRVGGVITFQERLRRRLQQEEQQDAEADDRPQIERQARPVIREHLPDSTFEVEDLAAEMAMSSTLLYRKFNEQSERTPAELITEMRMETALALLRDDEGTVTQVAYAVGYERLSSFSRAFKKYVGCSPSEISATHQQG